MHPPVVYFHYQGFSRYVEQRRRCALRYFCVFSLGVVVKSNVGAYHDCPVHAAVFYCVDDEAYCLCLCCACKLCFKYVCIWQLRKYEIQKLPFFTCAVFHLFVEHRLHELKDKRRSRLAALPACFGGKVYCVYAVLFNNLPELWSVVCVFYELVEVVRSHRDEIV